MGFQSKVDYANHVNNEHGLPVPELDPSETNPSTPILSSIKGGINYYELVPEVNDLEIMENWFRKRSEKMSLQKPTDEDAEKVTVYFNTHTTTVYYTGISDITYEDRVDTIVSKLVSFSSYGSSWQLQTTDKVTIKLVRYIPKRGSSFILFSEGHLLRRESNLLNIHNSNEETCFLYCFTPGYHLVHKKEKLEPPRSCFRPRTNILTYSSENPSAKQPVGDFDMPMSLMVISRFEDLNDVQVNVFR